VWCLPSKFSHSQLVLQHRSSTFLPAKRAWNAHTKTKVSSRPIHQYFLRSRNDCACHADQIISDRPKTSTPSAQASSSGEPEAEKSLSLEEARKILGISESASFEQTVQAKNKLLSKVGSDDQKQMQVMLLLLNLTVHNQLLGCNSIDFATIESHPVTTQEANGH
jgi:hypothetical protein